MGYLLLVAFILISAFILLKLADWKIKRLESELQISSATAKLVIGLKDQEIYKLKKGYEGE